MAITCPQVDKLGEHTITADCDTGIFVGEQVSIFNRRFIADPDVLVAVVAQVDLASVVQAILTYVDLLVAAINADFALCHHGTTTDRQAVVTPLDQDIDLLHTQPFCKGDIDGVTRFDPDAVATDPVVYQQPAALQQGKTHRAFTPSLASPAWSVCRISVLIVMGPTPPGTGV